TTRLTLSSDALGEEHFHERLVRYVARVRQGLELIQHPDREPNRDAGGGGLEIGEAGLNGARPIEIVGHVVLRPEAPLLVFVPKRRDWRPSPLGLAHRFSVQADSCPELRLHAPACRAE